jgi:hypothetical protein
LVEEMDRTGKIEPIYCRMRQAPTEASPAEIHELAAQGFTAVVRPRVSLRCKRREAGTDGKAAGETQPAALLDRELEADLRRPASPR